MAAQPLHLRKQKPPHDIADKKADSKPTEAAPNAESSSIESTSENSISCSGENVKKFRSCIFEGVGRLSLLKPVAKRGIMNTKSDSSVLTAKRQQTDGLK